MASRYSWKTDTRGRVVVNDPVGQEAYLPTLVGPKADHMETHVFAYWKKLCQKAAKDFHIPASWLLGIIYKESVGYAHTASTGLGIAGVRQPYFYMPDQTKILEPEVNIEVASKTLRNLISMIGLDLPSVASAYVAGLSSPKTKKPWLDEKSPWGLREPTGYILEVVSANNFAVTKGSKSSLFLPEDQDKTSIN